MSSDSSTFPTCVIDVDEFIKVALSERRIQNVNECFLVNSGGVDFYDAWIWNYRIMEE